MILIGVADLKILFIIGSKRKYKGFRFLLGMRQTRFDNSTYDTTYGLLNTTRIESLSTALSSAWCVLWPKIQNQNPKYGSSFHFQIVVSHETLIDIFCLLPY